MAAAYGYAQLPPILQQNPILLKEYSPKPIKNDVLGNLETFYNEKIIPGGQIPNGPVFSKFIEQFDPSDTLYPMIGEGAHGKVYILEFGDQKYVLKSIRLLSQIQIQYVKQEIKILQKLIGNPCAVQLLGSIIKYDPNSEYTSGTAYLLYPYIPGMTFKDYQEKYKEPTKDSINIFDKIIDAVEALHKTGILHSDIKPDNIWIPDDRTQSPFLLDFGVSQTLNENGSPVEYTRSVGAMPFWSHQQVLYKDLYRKNYPMSKGINWIALAKTFGHNDNYMYNANKYKYVTGQSPLNHDGRFKNLANKYNKNESDLRYEELKGIIKEMRKNLSLGGSRHTKRNKQKQNRRTCQNKKTKKRN